MPAPLSPPSPTFPLDKADLCVKCGLCLPHCPTYQLTQNEAESPRGRIALMQGMAGGVLKASPSLQSHLDRCLGCRSCESVCPAQVPYGELIDAGRALLDTHQRSRNRWLRRLSPWIIEPARRQLLGRLLWMFQFLGLHWLARLLLPDSSRLGRLTNLLPQVVSPPSARTYAATAPSATTVQLFTGCVSELVDGQLLKDSIYLLNRLGFNVSVPVTQNCCGAMFQHAGMTQAAQRQYQQNLDAFGATSQPIIGTATGCTATLKEYGIYNPGTEATSFAGRITDINRFISQHWNETLCPAPLASTALVQDPCSLRNVLGNTESVYRLLGHIPQLVALPLAGNNSCCGAAGSMMISEPQQADALLEDKLVDLKQKQPAYLLSSNVGCAMHMAGGVRRAGINTEVIHPVSLLARQLRLNA